MRRRGRGLTLGTALLMVSLIVTLAFSVTSVGVTHLNLTNRSSNSVRALNLARSAVALGYEKLLADSDLRYGADQAPGHLLSFAVDDKDGAFLTFSPTDAGLPVSVNNLQGSQPIAGWGGRVIPRGMAQLVGVGRYHGTERTVEVLLTMPPYPYAIACGGAIKASGGLIIGTVDPNRPAPTGPDDLGPADLVSNDPSATSVQLGPGSRVRGNLKTAGDVELAPATATTQAARVDGQLTTMGGTSLIPKLEIERLDPGASADPLLAQDVTNLIVAGSSRRQGNLVIDGKLTLNGGLLYVDGNLEAHTVEGEGTIVVTGQTLINGTTQVASSTGLAFISGGRMELKGAGLNSSRLKGLVYTNHSFKCEQITLEGALVANGPAGTLNEFVSASVWKNPEVATVPGEKGEGSPFGFSFTAGYSSTATPAVTPTPDLASATPSGGSTATPVPTPGATATIDVIDNWATHVATSGRTFAGRITRHPSGGLELELAQLGGSIGAQRLASDSFSEVKEAVYELTRQLCGADPIDFDSLIEAEYESWRTNNPAVSGGGTTTTVPPEELPDLNLSELLPPPSRVRIALWRE